MKIDKSVFKSILLGSKYEYEYSTGGFPRSGKPKFETLSKELEKVKNKSSRLKNLNNILQRAAATRLVYGICKYISPYQSLMDRAKELGATEDQIVEVESIKWDGMEDIKKEIFREFKY